MYTCQIAAPGNYVVCFKKKELSFKGLDICEVYNNYFNHGKCL